MEKSRLLMGSFWGWGVVPTNILRGRTFSSAAEKAWLQIFMESGKTLFNWYADMYENEPQHLD